MKKFPLAFTVFIFCFVSRVEAQSYVQFPDSNVTWILGVLYEDEPNHPYYSVSSFSDSGDTIISGLKYRKVMSGGYYAAYRKIGEDSIMVVPPDSTKEFLLYDFSIQIGDTVDVWTDGFVHPGINQIICSSISDPFEVSAHWFKQIYFQCCGSWITGVGGDQGPFTTNYIPSVSGINFLQCVMVADTVVYSPYNNCFGVGIPVLANEKFSLLPNPVQNLLTINLPSLTNALTLHVYDFQGREVDASTSLSMTQTSIELNTENLPAGFYTLQIINNKTGESEVGKFVKE